MAAVRPAPLCLRPVWFSCRNGANLTLCLKSSGYRRRWTGSRSESADMILNVFLEKQNNKKKEMLYFQIYIYIFTLQECCPFFKESVKRIALTFLFYFLRNIYQKKKEYFLNSVVVFCFLFFWTELEPSWSLLVLGDWCYCPNKSSLTTLAGRMMYVMGAHPVGTDWCLIWNLFGSVFYAFYFSIPLFFNSWGCLVNPLCIWQISEPKDIASLCLGH